MHGSIRNRLEDLLGAEQSAGHQDTSTHLSSCLKCSALYRNMRSHSEMLRGLRAPDEAEPVAGFYARVLQRIEEQARESIWAAFIYSRFADRLIYISLTVVVLLGSYVVAHEHQDGHLGSGSIVSENAENVTPVFGDQSQRRAAVLANFQEY